MTPQEFSFQPPEPAPVRVLYIGSQPPGDEPLWPDLAACADVECHHCPNATTAIGRMTDVQPTVILLELGGAGWNGLDLLTQIRSSPAGAEIPVIMLAPSDDAHNRTEAFVRGVSDYLIGRPGTTELVARLRYHSRAFAARQLLVGANRLPPAGRGTFDVLSHLTHAIRTPMNGVIGMAELLTETPLDPEQRSYVETLRRSGDTLLSVISEAVDLSRMEAGTLRLDSGPVDPRAIVDAVHASHLAQAEAKGLNLVRLIHEETPATVRGDAARLQQVLAILVGHAITFAERGEILIRVRPDDVGAHQVSLRFEVTMTGHGISGEETPGPGGPGLALSQHLVGLMDGAIGHESRSGAGTTSWFTARLGAVDEGAAPVDGEPRSSLRGIRAVFVIDPEDAVAELLSAAALSWGMNCDFMTPAEAGLHLGAAAGSREAYDLVVMDVAVEQALDLARRVRSRATSRVPAQLLLTLGGHGGLVDSTRDAGIDAVLSKPVSQDTLYRCLTAVLGTTPAPAGTNGINVLDRPVAEPRRPRVLVVDDNEVNQITAVRMLDKLHVDADVATDGHQAIAACRRCAYDFVLMDCEMPGMDGFTATAELRRIETTSATRLPIVAVTAHAQPGVRERCLEAGMDDYMPRPVRLVELRQMVARWTNADRANDAGAIDFSVIDELRDVDAAFAKELIGKFSSEAEDRIGAIQRAGVDHDASALAQLGHRLKGSCLTVGATGMADICAALEQSAMAADFEWGARLGLELRQEFERVRWALRQRIG